MMLQNALNYIIDFQGVNVSIKELSTGTNYTLKAAISNYFRSPLVDENIESNGRQYVISNSDLTFIPKRGDRFTVSNSEYYSIADVQELVVFSKIIGYRLVLK